MTAVDTIRSAVVGNPPDPKKKPDNAGVVQAFEELYGQVATLQSQVDAGQKPVYTLDLATTGNITLSGEQTIDGTLTSNSKVMVRGQTDLGENGPYISAAGAWTRLSAFDTGAELVGQQFFINGGSTQVGIYYQLQWTSATPPVVDTDNMPFAPVNKQNTAKPNALDALRAQANAVASATTLNLDTATGDYVPVAGAVDIDAVTLTQGRERWVIFTDDPAPKIVVGASLIGDNAGDDVQMRPGDMALFKGEAAGVVRFRTQRADPPVREAANVSSHQLADSDDNLVADFATGAAEFGDLRIEYGNPNGPEFTDRDDNLLPDFHPDGVPVEAGDGSAAVQTADLEPMFGPLLVGWEDEVTTLHVENLLRARGLGHLAQAELLGTAGGYARGDVTVSFDIETLGATAQLLVRPRDWDGAEFQLLDLNVGVASKTPGGAGTFVILPGGDSFTDNAGAYYIKAALNTRGYTATTTGTILGDDQNGVGANTGGYAGGLNLKGEGHSGWELGGFTNHDPDGSYIGGPGGPADVAAYFALPQIDMQNVNAFLRAETGGDAPSSVVNGTVFDLTTYYTRFAEGQPGVPTGRGVVPADVYLIGFGTNDALAQPAGALRLYASVRAAYLIQQIRAYAATKPIVFWVPGTPRDPDRDTLWHNNYVEYFLGLRDAQIAAADANVFVAPIFAFMPTDGLGFALRSSSAADAGSGARITGYDGNVHPFTALRPAMFTPLAAYAAAAQTGAI